jgi:uncharacterized protein (TIGR02996 family)
VSEQEVFLQALENDEDDTMTRLVYADWLEERGEHEEADRQRRWPAAKEWLVRFHRDYCADGDEETRSEAPDDENSWSYLNISYASLLKLAQKAFETAEEGQIFFFCGANESMMDALRANSREFWMNWSIVTGVSLPPDAAEKSRYSCAC